jgi:long-chain fatty acid transport protein
MKIATTKNLINIGKLLLTASLIVSNHLYADQYHFNNKLIGERALGLGGAYTAVADDASGLFYNPAGIAYSNGKSLSGSVNTFYFAETTYNDALGAGKDFTRTSSSLLPNFFGMVKPFGDSVIGFSYAVTDSILEDQDEQFENFGSVTNYILNINNQDNTTKIGPSYAKELGDTLAFGVTLYGHYRTFQTITNQWVHRNDNTQEWSNNYLQGSEVGLEPNIGLMWSPIDKLSIGLNFKTIFILTSSIDQQVVCNSDINNPTIQIAQCAVSTTALMNTPTLNSYTTKRDMPYSLAIGIAYFPSNKSLISSDISFHTATDTFEMTWNAALGIEYYLDPTFAIRGGLYTNNANTPELQTNGSGQLDHVNLFGIAISGTKFSRSSSVSVGMNFQSGSGEAQIIGGSNIQKTDYLSTTAYVASSYAF